jgi:AbrB family looped-hinge helix DNA binding protein
MSDPTIVRINQHYQLTLPESICEALDIEAGDEMVVDIQAGVIILRPQPRNYMEHLTGLHRELWQNLDATTYLDKERGTWTKLTKD